MGVFLSVMQFVLSEVSSIYPQDLVWLENGYDAGVSNSNPKTTVPLYIMVQPRQKPCFAVVVVFIILFFTLLIHEPEK